MSDPFKDTRDPLVRSMDRASRQRDQDEIERLRILVKRGRYLLCELNEIAGDYSGDWEVLADAIEKLKKDTREFNVRPGSRATANPEGRQ